MRTKFLNRFDYILILCTILLTTIGILFIYSSAFNAMGVMINKLYVRQTIWACAGFALMIFFALYDYRKFYNLSTILYAILILLLAVTWKFGIERNNAKSWLGFKSFSIQPSEIGKIVYILFLAKYLEKSKSQKQLKRFFIAIIIMILPLFLIFLQPDLGTASVYLPIFFFMCFIADIPLKYILFALSYGVFSILFTVLPVIESKVLKTNIPIIHIFTNTKILLIVIVASLTVTLVGLIGYLLFKKKYYYWITCIFGIFTFALISSVAMRKVLMEYQIMRLVVFVNPQVDPKGFGWHIIQSETAVGSGSLWGRGFLKGPQSHLRFTPEQSTDFIFSIYSEEMGFVGGMILFALFLVLFIRIIYIIKQTNSSYGAYICAGILGMLFFHFIVNVGMVIGLMPITGIPLPFLSYGGSALITDFIAMGLVMSVENRRLDFSVGSIV